METATQRDPHAIVRDIREVHSTVGEELGRLRFGIYFTDLRPEAKKLLQFAGELDAALAGQGEAAAKG